MLEDSAGSGEDSADRDDFGPPVSEDTMAALDVQTSQVWMTRHLKVSGISS